MDVTSTLPDKVNGYTTDVIAGGLDWAIFPCHSIVGGKCSCGKADCDSPGKHPRTANGLKDATADRTQVDVWWTKWRDANLAVATGAINDIVVIDIDRKSGGFDSLLGIEEQHGHLPETVEVETGGGGRHLYYRYPANANIHSRNGWRPGIDVKADGGYVVAPPSNHVSGKNYRWVAGQGPSDVEVAEIPAWLLELLPRKDEAPQTTPPFAPSADGHSSLLQRAQAYVAKAAATNKGNRDNTAFRLAGHVAAFRDGTQQLSEAEIFSMLGPWNLRCNPPLSDEQLRKCIASACENGTPRPAKESSYRQSHDRNGDSQSPPKPLEKFTLARLRDSFPRLRPPVVNGLFRQGETCNIISHSKAGKSWLLYGLMLSEITRTPWFGHETSGGRGMICDNELHPSTLAHRIPLVGEAMGLPPEFYVNDLDIIPLRGKLRSFADIVADFDAIQPGQYSIIGFDAKYRFILPGVSENDNSAETLFYNLADELATRTGAALVFIHHTSKGLQSDKRITDVGSGAGAQSRAADCHIILREHEEPNVAVMDAALRSFAPVAPKALRWSFPLWQADEQLDPARLKRQPTGSQQQQANQDREGINKIIAVLRHGPLTGRQLRSKTGFGKYRQDRLLDQLTAGDHVEVSEVENGGTTSRVYKLKE